MPAITSLAAHILPQLGKTLIDHHFTARPFFHWFYKNRRVTHEGGLWYQTTRIKSKAGTTVAVPLNSTALAGPTTLARQTSAAQYFIKGYRTPVHITWEDELKSKGALSVIDVADTQLYQGTKEHVDKIASDFVISDGVGPNIDQLRGVLYGLLPTEAYGEIDPAVEPDWTTQMVTVNTALSGPGVITAMVNKLKDGNDRPDIGGAGDDIMTRLQLFANQLGQLQTAGGDSANIGFDEVTIHKVKFIKDKDFAAGFLPILTSKYWEMAVDGVYDFRFSGFNRPIGEVYNTGDIRTALMVRLSNRRRQGGWDHIVL